MNRKIQTCFFVVVFITILSSCVTKKEFANSKNKLNQCLSENQKLKDDNRNLTVLQNELQGENETFKAKIARIDAELLALQKESISLKEERDRTVRSLNDLEKQIEYLKKGSSEEITKLLDELKKMQNDLQAREDRVRKAEEELNKQKSKLLELQTALDNQKQAVSSLKQKVLNALLGYQDQGLTVHEKNGKVYVSLDEKLLFNTGSYDVDPKGKAALGKLSEVLSKNSNISIVIEGHTDDVPLKGANQIKDNWDLSVMRATAVTKILLADSKIDPKRITASGRGEFFPLDQQKTPEARQKNRRTEIILTPDLDEVFKIIQTN